MNLLNTNPLNTKGIVDFFFFFSFVFVALNSFPGFRIQY